MDSTHTAASGFDVLEHTADVGIGAWGPTVEVAVAMAARGLVDLLEARGSGPAERRVVRATGPDLGGVLVEFLNELLVLHEVEEVALGEVEVRRVDDNGLEAEVEVRALEGEPGGVSLKAATYHRLRVDRRANGVEIEVYLDV